MVVIKTTGHLSQRRHSCSGSPCVWCKMAWSCWKFVGTQPYMLSSLHSKVESLQPARKPVQKDQPAPGPGKNTSTISITCNWQQQEETQLSSWHHFRGWTEEKGECIAPQNINTPTLLVWTMNCFRPLKSKDNSKEYI
jgi:hypothetical protein